MLHRTLQLGLTPTSARVLLLLGCVLSAGRAAARDVVVEIVAAKPGVRCEITAFGDVPLKTPVSLDGTSRTVRIEVPESATELVPVAKGCWAAPLQFETQAGAPLVLEMWPAATVIGGISFEVKSEEPRTISGSLLDAVGEPRQAPVVCTIDAKVWRCTVPAGRPLHLQVSIDDFAPVFAWDVNLATEAVLDTGIQTLVRGAAVAGRAMLDDRKPAANARVRIVPLSAGHQSPTDRVAKARETRANAGGHFQLAGLEPGVYRVVSTVDGRGDAVVASLELRAGEHLQLREPLMHADLAEVVVLLTPPVSSSQSPWTVELLSKGERDMELVSVAKSAASVDGSWSRNRLQPKLYHLRVFAPNGSQMVARDVELHGGREEIGVDVSALRVTGKVLLRDEGIAAGLIFDKDRMRVTATADHQGVFAAEFPAEGAWKPRVTIGRTTLRLEEVEIAHAESKELILRIAGGGVRGKVLDPHGKPVANAYVRLKRNGPVSNAVSNEDGAYEIVGVEPGAYSIEAEANETFGGPLPVSIAKDDVVEIDLRLESFQEVTGVVTLASGAAASGAVVRTFDPATGMVEDTFADARGAFSFKAAPRSSVIDVIVLAPPAPVAVRRIAIGERRSQSLHVQLSPSGAKLRVFVPRVPPYPTLAAADGGTRSLGLLLMPLFEGGTRRELVDGGFNFIVEPGPYRMCYATVPCRDLHLTAHAETVVNLFAPIPSEGN